MTIESLNHFERHSEQNVEIVDVLLSETNGNGPVSCFSLLSWIKILVYCGRGLICAHVTLLHLCQNWAVAPCWVVIVTKLAKLLRTPESRLPGMESWKNEKSTHNLHVVQCPIARTIHATYPDIHQWRADREYWQQRPTPTSVKNSWASRGTLPSWRPM